jgi:acyl carrier protein
MNDRSDHVRSAVKEYILEEFLPGEDPESLTVDTPLISGGILDSIATIRLIDFLEQQYGVSFDAHEISADHLDTLDQIAGIVVSKL